MAQAGSIRFQRGVTAAVVLLAHVLLVWLVIQVRVRITEREMTAEPVLATLLETPRRVPPGALPIEVKVERVQHLQNLAPKLPDIPEDSPEPISNIEPAPLPAPSNLTAPLANDAEAGADSASSGPRGDGRLLSLVQRVVPTYPFLSARRGEQGATVLQLRVDERGRVVEAKVARSSGFSRLDQSALEAVRKWKFAAAASGTAPKGTWGQIELRFTLYRFTYSRLGEQALDQAFAEQVKSGEPEQATPGSEAALKRFIAEVKSGAITGDPDPQTRGEIARLRAALDTWGEVESLRFTGAAAGSGWAAYDIKPVFRAGPSSVEVRWNMYEVRHQHATTEWLIAVGREGTIWTARAGPAPTR